MSTNAIIGKLQADGTVRSVYLHHDGYFSYAGRILRTFYRTEKRIDALLALGNLSRLGPTPYGKNVSTPQVPDIVHCRAYIRDCGSKQKQEKAEIYPSKELFFAGAEVAYLYDNGHWYHVHRRRVTDISSPLVSYLKEEYGSYPNLESVEIFSLKSGNYPLKRITRNVRTWQELDELATQERKKLYVFRQKDNRLIRIVRPQKNSKQEELILALQEWNDTVLKTQARPFLTPLGLGIRFDEEAFDEDEQSDGEVRINSIFEKEILYRINYLAIANRLIRESDCSHEACKKQIHLIIFHKIGRALIEMFSNWYGDGDEEYDELIDESPDQKLTDLLKGRSDQNEEKCLAEDFAVCHYEGRENDNALHRFCIKYFTLNAQNTESHENE